MNHPLINLQTDLLRAFVSVIDLSSFTKAGTALGRSQPAISLPCGFTSGGLPIGLQIVGRKGDDERVCAFGAQLEHSLAATRPAQKHKKSA